MADLHYTPTEKLTVKRPVDRIKYLRDACINKKVLDLGCYDETALVKEDTGNYLFGEISKVSALHVGVDNSKLLINGGITYSDTVRIMYGDIYNLDKLDLHHIDFDVIIAGELIEHLPNTLVFFENLKKQFAGKRLICSTPNATSLHNMILSLIKRESAHIDHVQVYSYKTLNTLCKLAGFSSWQIIPYHVKFSEMILNAKGGKKQVVKICERIVNGFERIFPMTGGGYIIDITI
ncbi:methyltransferase domain-containing protein [Danxiaibacter flavus]|uniref:Methyltransferase domain-containing protein n=1 Tax=Danxiaibacter flavus TaxID=3049108 RepID=A0ABV3ZFZ5_9BACT|nr:methyltransferase domain-containing protein [Chitinophagaceae bacterium DXS]